jgi:hypothetical protein
MSDVIDDDDTDALAAEYVLGTLDAEERTHANLLLDIDDAFRGKVRVWERRLGELHLMVEAVEPAPQILERIKAKMESVTTADAAAAKMASTEAASTEAATSKPELVPPSSSQSVETKTSEKETAEEARPEPDSSKPREANDAQHETTLDALEAEVRNAGLAVPATEEMPASATVFPEPETGAAGDTSDKAGEPGFHPLLRERHAVEQVAPRVTPKEAEALRPALRRWRAVAVLLFMVALALGVLMAVWRYAPERLPPELSVHSVLNMPLPPPPAPPKPKPPPESVFDE